MTHLKNKRHHEMSTTSIFFHIMAVKWVLSAIFRLCNPDHALLYLYSMMSCGVLCSLFTGDAVESMRSARHALVAVRESQLSWKTQTENITHTHVAANKPSQIQNLIHTVPKSVKKTVCVQTWNKKFILHMIIDVKGSYD